MSGDKKHFKILVKLVPGFIRRDFLRKFIALAFAVIVWNRVSVNLDEENVVRGVPIKISIPEEFIRLDDANDSLDVTLRGPHNQLVELSAADISVKVKPRRVTVGVNNVILGKKDVVVPLGINVVSIAPEKITVSLDRKMVKEAPVELVCSGMLLDDYAFRVAELNPNVVTVSGPQGVVDRLDTLRTEPVTLRRENVEDFDCEVQIRHPAKVDVRPNRVLAKIEIYKNHDSRVFENVPINPYGFIPPGTQLTFKPGTVSILVEGTKRAVERATPDKLKAFVDLSELHGPGEWRMKTQCWLNDKELSVKRLTPATVKVVLEKCRDKEAKANK